MADPRPSSPRFSADRLFAVGGSLALHGIAVAAVMTSLAGGVVEESPAPPTITLTMEWAGAPNHAIGQSVAPAAPTKSSANEVTMTAPMSEPVIEAAEARVDPTAALPKTATAEATANEAIEMPQIPPPAHKSTVVARAKPQPTAARGREDGVNGQQQAEPTIATNSASPQAGSETEIAMTEAGAAGAPAPPAGERGAWSVTSRIPPAYPMSARRRGIEGEVELRVDVDADGRPRLVTIARSSGDRQLDSAAAQAVEQWRFAVASPMAIEIPIQFRLNAGDLAASQP